MYDQKQNDLNDIVENEFQRSKKNQILSIILLFVIIIVFTLWRRNPAGTIKMQWTESALKMVDPSGEEYVLDFETLKKVSYRKNWDFGSSVSGKEDNTYRYGLWENSEIGVYRLFSYSSSKSIILMETDKDRIALNYESDAVTGELYKSFQSTLAEQGYYPEFPD